VLVGIGAVEQWLLYGKAALPRYPALIMIIAGRYSLKVTIFVLIKATDSVFK
jgi:hypothetical protein